MAKIEFLKQRAEEFLKTANFHLKEGFYHLAAFDLEQALQLYLKYYLFLKLKEYPKTHSLRELMENLGKAYDIEPKIKKIINENIHLIANLEEAYITSRYLPIEFTLKQIEQMKEFVENLIKFLKSL